MWLKTGMLPLNFDLYCCPLSRPAICVQVDIANNFFLMSPCSQLVMIEALCFQNAAAFLHNEMGTGFISTPVFFSKGNRRHPPP